MKGIKLFRSVCGVLLIVVLLVIAACAAPPAKPAAPGEPAAPPAAEVYELTFAVQHPITCGMMAVVNPGWYNWLDRESGGRIKITPLASEQAAKAPDLYDAAKDGVVDIACQLPGFNPGRWPLSQVVELPFILPFPGCRVAAQTQYALFQKYPEIGAQLGDGTDVKIIGFHANGLSHIHTVDKPVKTMADMKGLICNVLGSEGVAAIKALGGTPETVLPGEMYDAMAKGVIDANALEWEGQIVWHLNELTHYSTQVGIHLITMIHAMNIDTWNSLPPDLQALFEGENANRIGMLHGYNFDKDDIMFEGLLDKQYKDEGGPGVYVLPDAERAKWMKACEPIHEAWVQAVAPEVGEAKARAILDDAKKFAAQFAGYPDEGCPDCEGILHDWGAPGY